MDESKAWANVPQPLADWERELLNGMSNVTFIPLGETPIFGDIPMPPDIWDVFDGEGF